MSNWLKLRKGNFLAIAGKSQKMIEIETSDKTQAEKLATDYFRSRHYKGEITVIKVPDCVTVFGPNPENN